LPWGVAWAIGTNTRVTHPCTPLPHTGGFAGGEQEGNDERGV